ncbi:MAG: MarR family transcriptional regulator [Gemmatimonadaceae bacterium]
MTRAREPVNPEMAPAVAERLHRVAISMLRRLRTEDRRTGLSGPRASALSVVVFAGPMTLGELAAAEQVRAPTMTRLVQGLVDQGLVERERDLVDARMVRVRATAEGVRLLHEGRARRLARLEQALGRIPARELRTLGTASRLLESLVREL